MAQIFADGFESGDTSAWDGSAGTPTVTVGSAMVGTYGCEINAASEYVEDDFAATTTVRLRFYLDPNGFSMSSDVIRIITMRDSGTQVGQIQMRDNGANYELRIRMYNDSAAWESSSYYTILDAPNCIEGLWVFTNTTGYISLWFEGVLQETVSNIDTGTRDADNVRFGWLTTTGTPSGTLYIDHYESNDDGSEIGCVAVTGQPLMLRATTVPHSRQWQPGAFR